jgi:hypothetical protein
VADLNHDVSILLPGEEARGASTFDCFDDDHAAAAAWAWMREDARLGLIAVIGALRAWAMLWARVPLAN